MKFPMADAHCDFLYYMVMEGCDITSRAPDQSISLPHLIEGGVALQFFAVWVDSDVRITYLQQCLNMIDAYYRMLDANECFVPMSRAFKPSDGKIATVLTIEGGNAIAGSLENLRLLRRLGVTAMSLTWNETNDLASPAMRRGNKGLTKLGRRVVRQMCDVSMAVDVAHLSDQGIDDVLEIATRPIFASHTNSRAVCDHRRSMIDEHIRAIAKAGGIVCVNFYPKQLTDQPQAYINDVVRHIMHIIEVGGIDAVGIGSDFSGMVVYPVDIQDSSKLPNLANALLAAGLSEGDVYKVAYGNLARYISMFL